MQPIVNLVRNGLGWILAIADKATRPEPIKRTQQQQQDVEEEAQKLSIYQFYGCPFCVKVRRAVHRLNLPIEYRDAQNNSRHRTELKKGGGKIQVPCLRIDREDQTKWMYESSDIVDFLEERFE